MYRALAAKLTGGLCSKFGSKHYRVAQKLCKGFIPAWGWQTEPLQGLQALALSRILAFTPASHEPSTNVPKRHNPRRINREPRWRPARQYTTAEFPPSCRHWVLDDSSLTVRLVALNRGAFRVQRLYQGWQLPQLSESRLLGVSPCQRALVREVGLMLANQTVVFARSVFPIASLTGDLAHLRYLQNKSLGAILFKHPGMHRTPFELARMDGDCDYLPPQLRQGAPAWGRRSRFVIGGRALLVSEVFLQGFTPWTSDLAVHRAQRGKVIDAAITPSTQ